MPGSPSTSLGVINSRLDLVGYMLHDEPLRERLTLLLRRSYGSHRLLQKFAFGRGDPDDLLALASTVYATQELMEMLVRDCTLDDCLQSMVVRIQLDRPSVLALQIKEGIDEEGIVQQRQIEEGESGAMQALAQEVITSTGLKEDS